MTMNLAERIQHEVSRLPEPLIREVLDFIGYLEYRHGLIETNVRGDRQRNSAKEMAGQAIAMFRGSGKGGGTERLLMDRQTDREREA